MFVLHVKAMSRIETSICLKTQYDSRAGRKIATVAL